MKVYRYNRLGRNKSETFLATKGVKSTIVIVRGDQYKQALRDKLVEEAHEVVTAQSHDELIEELADVSELMQAIYAAYNISPAQIERARKAKEESRGSFSQGLLIKTFEVNDGAPADRYYQDKGLELISE